MTTEELIEVLKQYPGKTVVVYRGDARGYESLHPGMIDLEERVHCDDDSWVGRRDFFLWPDETPEEGVAL